MKLIALSLLLLTSLVSTVPNAPPAGAAPIQFCKVDEQKGIDLCFALASSHNSTTNARDLSLQLSARFPVKQTGWVGVGVGGEMKGALMFVMYSGFEDGSVTVSVRTAASHVPPTEVKAAGGAPDIHVTRTWVSEDNLNNADLICYNCESWTGSKLDAAAADQSWIWAVNRAQRTGRADAGLHLVHHTARGIAYLDMSTSYSPSADPNLAQVSTTRISTPGLKKHHAHAILGIVSIHGFLLSISFFALSLGALSIRSGLAKSFEYHWVIQTVASATILFGCLLGIIISFSHGGHFSTTHQIIGLMIAPMVGLQALLGYWHHVLFLRSGKRSAVSVYHVWLGRIVMLVGNVNVWFGLKLGHASWITYLCWLAAVVVQLTFLVPMWHFWSKGKKIMDVVAPNKDAKEGVEYASVEQEAFLVGEDDDIELEDERDKKEELERK